MSVCSRGRGYDSRGGGGRGGAVCVEWERGVSVWVWA